MSKNIKLGYSRGAIMRWSEPGNSFLNSEAAEKEAQEDPEQIL